MSTFSDKNTFTDFSSLSVAAVIKRAPSLLIAVISSLVATVREHGLNEDFERKVRCENDTMRMRRVLEIKGAVC